MISCNSLLKSAAKLLQLDELYPWTQQIVRRYRLLTCWSRIVDSSTELHNMRNFFLFYVFRLRLGLFTLALNKFQDKLSHRNVKFTIYRIKNYMEKSTWSIFWNDMSIFNVSQFLQNVYLMSSPLIANIFSWKQVLSVNSCDLQQDSLIIHLDSFTH